jgi:hypothetical protein
LGAKIVLLFQTSKFYAEKLDFRIPIQRKVVPLQRVSLEAQIFLLLNYPAELRPRKGFKSEQYYIEAAHHSADFIHSSIGAVASLAGYMAGVCVFYAKIQTFFIV